MMCWTCGREIPNEGYTLTLLSEGHPVCRNHAHHADEIVDASCHLGYPEGSDETELNEPVTWLEIEDRISVTSLMKENPSK